MAVRILICDDEPVVHESLHIYFEAEGYEVVDAYDGEEGLQKADSSISLMILDIMMPKKSGVEVCREIRKTSSLPIVMLTAKGEEARDAQIRAWEEELQLPVYVFPGAKTYKRKVMFSMQKQTDGGKADD